MSIRWVIQNNLGSSGETERLVSACSDSGVGVRMVKVIPFSDELPDVPEDLPTIFYGATNFINTVWKSGKWRPAAWYSNEAFSYDNYIAKYGDQMLNADGRIMTMEQFGLEKHDREKLFFVRPIRDLKEFSGELMTFGCYSDWFDGISHGGFTIGPDCLILVADPKEIAEEFRLFIVEGRVVAASRYKKGSRFSRHNVTSDVSSDVLLYGEQQSRRYSPAPIFVMDIGITEEGPKIIELGSFNSAGLYAANEADIVEAVNSYVKGAYHA
jgi:hypothetical protein